MNRASRILHEIDVSSEGAYGRIYIYPPGNVMGYTALLQYRRSNHPRYPEYKEAYKGARMYNLTLLVLFCRYATASFKESYYAPGGKGYIKAASLWNTHVCLFGR